MRLIDGDEIEELFREVISGIAKKQEMTGNLEHMVRASAMVIEMLHDAPTVDAVPVVRCKDCKHHHYQNGIPYCDRYYWGWKDDDFCSAGERKDGEQHD